MQKSFNATLFVLSCIVGGCASHNSNDAAIKEALQEKEAAYIRLAKAITTYCSASTETIGARQSCIVERRLAADQPDGAQQIVPTVPFPSHLRSSR